MSGSITDSDACGNDWDNTWIPPTGSGAEPSNLPIVWKSPWKKVDIILVDHSGQKEIISDETGCFVPVKFQYLITNRLRHLQTLIHKIQSLDVKSIQTRDELLEITTKADVHLRASGEIATVLLNELEDIYLKMIQRFPFTCSIAEELFKGHLQIMMIRDESKVYVVGPSTCKSLICNTIDQFNSLISKESISFDEKWKRVAVGYLKTVPFLLQQYPTVSISTKEDAKEMLLEGTKSDVRNAVKELYNVISSVHVEQIPIDSLVGKLLLCPEASSLFSSILESQQMAVSWTIDGDSLTVVSKESIPAGIVHQLLVENFVVAGFSSKDNSPSAFTNSEPFRDTVQRNNNSLLVVEKESTGYKVASTKLIIRNLLHREHVCSEMVCESVQVGKSHSDIEDLQAKNRRLEHNFHTMKKCYMEALAEIKRLKSNSGNEFQAEVKMKPSMDELVQQECYTNFSGDVFQEDAIKNYTEGQLVRHQRQMSVPILPTEEKPAVFNQGLHQSVVAEKNCDIKAVKSELEEDVGAIKKKAGKLSVTVKQEKPKHKWVRICTNSTRKRQVTEPVILSDEISKQIDEAYNQHLPSVEIEEIDAVYFYHLDKHEYHIIGKEFLNGVFYKQDVYDDHVSSVDPALPVPNAHIEGKQTSTFAKKHIYKETSFFISPSFRSHAYQGMILEMMKVKGFNFDATSWKVTCSYDSILKLNRQMKEKFNTQDNVITTEPGSAYLSPLEQTTTGDIPQVIFIGISLLDYKMLKFFFPDCKIFQGDFTFDNGKLWMFLQDEPEDMVKQLINSKLIHLETFHTQEVTMPATMKIDNTKWQEVKREVNAIAPDIFCFRSNDGKTLTLKSNKYEQLQIAKVQCEFVLGLKIQSKGRKGRVIATDPQYNKDDMVVVSTSSRSYDKRGPSNFARSFSSGSNSSPTSPSVPELTFNSDGIMIKVYVGNILNLDVECIVNAANENLSHGGGVADVISRAAGYKFQDESDDYIRQRGQLKATECCTTSAGNLKYKCVIHAVGPRFYQYTDRRKCADYLEQTIVNCLGEADKQHIKSIVLPPISSGIFGVPKEICSQQYCTGTKRYCSTYGKTTSLKEIHFMDKDPVMVKLIQAEFTRHMIVTNNLT